MRSYSAPLTILVLLTLSFVQTASAQDSPHFVTYDHHLEEPGSLELSVSPVLLAPKDGHRALASSMEFEYGAKGWWTTSLYLDGQTTFGEGTLFTGYRWENRFRLFMRERWINPVVYVEFSNVNGADKTLKEIVGFDSWRDQVEPNHETRIERKRELEMKLILSRNYRGWNFAGNAIAEKALEDEPWEFGYAVGVSRPFALAASSKECRVCRENFSLGIELYGGVGEWRHVTLSGTSSYLAAGLSWSLPDGVTIRVSPAIGLTSNSHRALVRFGTSYEFNNLGRRVRGLF